MTQLIKQLYSPEDAAALLQQKGYKIRLFKRTGSDIWGEYKYMTAVITSPAGDVLNEGAIERSAEELIYEAMENLLKARLKYLIEKTLI
jgi:hypothetical protein